MSQVTRQQFKNLAAKFVNTTFNDFTQSYTLESVATTADGQGGFTTVWSTVATITGFVRDLRADEVSQDSHLNTQKSKMFSFQYQSNIDTKMRILYDSKYYNIRSVKAIQDADVWHEVIADEDEAT